MYRLRRRGLLIVSLLFMLAVHANAQLEYTNWIFGRGGGLRFNDGRGVLVTPPVGFPGTMLVTDGETSAWSDPCTGELELYSDGHSIRNARHDVIEGGDGVGGIGNTFRSLLGGVLFVPHPAHWDTVFLVSAVSLPDLGQERRCHYYLRTISRAGHGKPWTVRSGRLFGDTLVGEARNKVAATHDASRMGYWIFTTYYDNRKRTSGIATYHVGAEGFEGGPVVSPMPLQVWDGQLICSRDGRRLVHAGGYMDGGHFEHGVDVIDVDNATGRCRLRGKLDLEPIVGYRDQHSIAKYRHAYGVGISPSGRYAYVNTRINQAFDSSPIDPTVGVLVQFDLDAGSWPDVQGSGVEITTTSLWSPERREWGDNGYIAGGMQLGPDGVIYVAGSDRMSVIRYPDVAGRGCTFVRDSIESGGIVQSFGMPNIITSSFLKRPPGQCFPAIVDLEAVSVCEGEPLTVDVAINGWSDDTTWSATGPGGIRRTQKGGGTFVWPLASAGTYTVGVSAKGYFGIVMKTIEVVVHPRPVVDAGDTMNVCSGGSVHLRATGAATYRWEPSDGLDDTTSATPIASDVRTDRRYVVTGTSEQGCIDIDTVWIRIAALQGTVMAPTSVCSGEEAVVTVAGGSRIRWIDGYTSSDPQEYSIRVHPAVRTTYRAIVDDGACSDTLEVTIDVLPSPTLGVDDDTTVCRGTSVRLHATGAATYRWEPATGLDDPAVADPLAMPEATTTYRVTAVDADGCVAIDSITITIDELDVMAMADTIVCGGSTVRLTATGNGRHRWFALPERIPLDGVSPDVTVTMTTDYMVLADQGACVDDDTVRIVVEPFPTLSVSGDTTICAGDVVTLEAYGSVSVEWSEDGTLIPDDEGRIVVSPEKTTLYVATASSGIGCRTVDTVTVGVGNGSTIVVSAPTLVAKPDDRVVIPIRIRSSGYRGPLDVEPVIVPPIVALDAADAGRRTIMITDDDQTLALHGLAVLGASTQAVIDPVIHADGLSRCFGTEVRAGAIALEGCAIDRRFISILGSMKVRAVSVAAGLSIEMDGGTGIYDVTWYDPYGRATYRASGLTQREIVLLPEDLTPIGFLDIRSGAERIMLPVLTRQP